MVLSEEERMLPTSEDEAAEPGTVRRALFPHLISVPGWRVHIPSLELTQEMIPTSSAVDSKSNEVRCASPNIQSDGINPFPLNTAFLNPLHETPEQFYARGTFVIDLVLKHGYAVAFTVSASHRFWLHILYVSLQRLET